MDNPGPLQEIMTDVATDHLAPRVEMDLNKFAKAGRVVVPGGFGISKCLQYRVGIEDLGLQRPGWLAEITTEIVEDVLREKSIKSLSINKHVAMTMSVSLKFKF